jgi:hypothetical protein
VQIDSECEVNIAEEIIAMDGVDGIMVVFSNSRYVPSLYARSEINI